MLKWVKPQPGLIWYFSWSLGLVWPENGVKLLGLIFLSIYRPVSWTVCRLRLPTSMNQVIWASLLRVGASAANPVPDDVLADSITLVEATVVAVVPVGTPGRTTPIPSRFDTLLTTAVTTACAASGGNWASTDLPSGDEDGVVVVDDSERDGVDEYMMLLLSTLSSPSHSLLR